MASPLCTALLLGLALSGPASTFSPAQLWEVWPAARFVHAPAPCLRHAELVEAIRTLEQRHPGRLTVEEVGDSVEGRAIHLLTVGRGPRRVLLWSQMHGDEPSATPALLDLADFLLSSPDPAASAILDGATLFLVPMLNPDGAERYVRRNAQAIDINRDALQLATPEGRILKAVRDRFEPELGFNLHDQDRRTTVGDSGRLATVALLAVAGDAAGTVTPGRARARRAAAAIARALDPLVPGAIARYDEDWNPRAFGDNITAWGTPVVLIESGGLPPDWTYEGLTRLNFVALLTALQGLVADDLAGEDPDVYESLERNRDHLWVDVLVSGGEVWQPGAGPPYRAEIAFDRLDPDPVRAACDLPGPPDPSRVKEVGDGRLLGAARTVDAAGALIVPAFAAALDGLDAGEWLDDEAATALGRLGVARLEWRVNPSEREQARTVARELAGPGRPAIEVSAKGDETCLLTLSERPATPRSSRLDDVLSALTRGTWQSREARRSLAELLGPLTRCPPVDETAAALVPTGPASLLLLRPRSPEGREAGDLVLEAVFIDGREPGTGE